LQSEGILNSQESKTHIPDLPETEAGFGIGHKQSLLNLKSTAGKG